MRVAVRVNMIKRNLMRSVQRRRAAKQLNQLVFGQALAPDELHRSFEKIDLDNSTLEQA